MSIQGLTRALSGLNVGTTRSNGLSWSSNGVCSCAKLNSSRAATQVSTVPVETVCGKMKTRKAVAKRFKVTGGGKITRRRPGKQHINEKMSRSKLRKLGKTMVVGERDLPNIAPNLPYSGVKQSGN